MSQPRSTEGLESSLAPLLRWGVLLAATVCLLGGVHYLVKHGSDPVHVRIFHGEPAELRGLRGILTLAAENDSRGIIQLSLILLVAVPIVRVAISAIAFLRESDWIFAALSFTVLSALLFSLLFEH